VQCTWCATVRLPFFGTDDYDRLTPTGFMQRDCWAPISALRQVRFDAVYTGTLRRHAETAQGIFEGTAAGDAPDPQRRRGLDEYSSEALVLALKGVHAAPAPAAVRPRPPHRARGISGY